jgi:uncharacterized protein (TIGR03118 family)
MQNDLGRSMARTLAGSALCALCLFGAGAAHATVFEVQSLITDDQAAHPAALLDTQLVNAWGISYAPTGPFWVSDNGAGVSTLYSVNNATNNPVKLSRVVTIPGDGTPTGQVNTTGAPAGSFNGDAFLFVSEDGTISGWRLALGNNAETLQTGTTANVYKGAAIATVNGYSYLYATNFRNGTVDVLKGDASAPSLTGTFNDPTLPSGYAPFGIQKIGNTIYVTYALQDAAKHDDSAGAGHGFVDAYDLNGNLLGRVASQGTLNSPWGLAIAPADFGAFAGDLLVGNFGDGTINAFSLAHNDAFAGQLTDASHTAISLDGLWGLIPGNDGLAGSSDQIYFSSGPDGESRGLFGALLPVPEPASLALLGAGLGILALRRRRG